MCGSMVNIQSPTAEIRRGIKKDRRNKPQGKNIMFASATQGGHKKYLQIASPVLLNSCETFYNVYARKKENSECPESARWTPAQCAWPLKDVTKVYT